MYIHILGFLYHELQHYNITTLQQLLLYIIDFLQQNSKLPLFPFRF
jgi:hypothetical protein